MTVHPRLAALLALTLLAPMPLAAQIVDADGYREMEGMAIATPDGVEVGEVDDVVIAPNGTDVAVVIEAGGFLGMGEREVIVPLGRLELRDGMFVTGLTRDEIEALPEWQGD